MHKNLSDTGRKSKPNRQISDRYQDTCIGRFTSLNCLCDVLLLCCFCLHCHPSRRFWALSPSEIRIFVSFLVLFSSSYAFFLAAATHSVIAGSLRNLGGCDLRQSLAASSNRKTLRSHRVLKDSTQKDKRQKTNTVLAANNTYSRIKNTYLIEQK